MKPTRGTSTILDEVGDERPGHRVRILAFAYSCEPKKGSEPGAGWAWSRMLARLGEVWVITRTRNREVIEAALPTLPERDRLHFVYVDLPGARLWKRPEVGERTYYFLWQTAALARARSLRREVKFEIVWHLTLANVWFGSFAPLAGGTFVYGPVGGAVGVPWRLMSMLGLRGAAFEVARELSRTISRYLNPLARLAWRRASLILVQNPETLAWLPRRHRHKAHVFPHVALEDLPHVVANGGGKVALFAGRLVPWKGASLAIEAIARAQGWQMVICGEGPDERRLRRLVERLAISDRVEFIEWQDRDSVLALMSKADTLLFPTLHDEAGWVVTEAMAVGLEVVGLNRGGPPVLARESGFMVSIDGSKSDLVGRLAAALNGRRPDRLSREAIRLAASEFTLERRLDRLRELLAIQAADGGEPDRPGREA